ncbi:hypothetical protein EMGBS6_16990 [Opitutia bacterium]|nr:hypothetical protein EMGBS6_16990 [Opitutae bacterium]
MLVDENADRRRASPAGFRSLDPHGRRLRLRYGIQLSNIAQAEAGVAQAEQNDHPSLNLSVGSSRFGNPGAGVSGGYDAYRQQAGWSNYAELKLSFPLGFRESEANLRSAYRARRQAELRLADARQSLVFGARASWRELEAARAVSTPPRPP